MEDLELNFKVITPNKVSVSKTTDPQLEVSKNVIPKIPNVDIKVI